MVGAGAAFGGERENAAPLQGGKAIFKGFVQTDAGKFMIIEPGTLHFGRIQRETQRLHQMQFGTAVGAQADDVAGVGRDFGLV